MTAKSKRRHARLLDEAFAVRPVELPPKVSMSMEARLRSIVRGCLGGPRGDPDEHHMLAAAHALLLLKDLGEADLKTEEFLRSNTWKLDFLDLAERDISL